MVNCAKDDVFLCFIRVYTLAFVASETESETTAVSHILQTLSLVTKKKTL